MKKNIANIKVAKRTLLGLVVVVALLTVLAVMVSRNSQNDSTPIQQGDDVVDYTDINNYRYTAEYIEENYSSRFNCWTIIEGKVYTVTEFVLSHPDAATLEAVCGIDGTEIFKKQTVYKQLVDGNLPDTIIQRGVLYEKPQRTLFDY